MAYRTTRSEIPQGAPASSLFCRAPVSSRQAPERLRLMTLPITLPQDLPAGCTARLPVADDIEELTALVAAHQRFARGWATVDIEGVTANVTGIGSWTRRQVVVEAENGAICAWAWVHDRAAGRTMPDVTVAPAFDGADEVARSLLGWVRENAAALAAQRHLDCTQLDYTAYATDERQRRWFAEDGLEHTRTWLQMTRPVTGVDDLPPIREGVTVRRVAKHHDGMPVAQDLQIVHQMLEESFADHFNSYRESFPEFMQRLREDPGHRWDHWWIADVVVDGETVPGGALVASVMSADSTGAEGSYVDYIGVHRRARGLGVAKALLSTLIRDAYDRGRNRVDLEVDSDSPTGANGLYESMGWVTKYSTESWHAEQYVDDVTDAS